LANVHLDPGCSPAASFGRSPSGALRFRCLSWSIKNLRKRFDIIKAHAKLISHQHIPITH
jgi:hypothetical protein